MTHPQSFDSVKDKKFEPSCRFPRRADRQQGDSGSHNLHKECLTMKFAMLICGPDTPSTESSPDEMREVYAWFEKWGQAGKIADGGVELDATRKAKTIRYGEGGAPVVTDGPYLELKEVVG